MKKNAKAPFHETRDTKTLAQSASLHGKRDHKTSASPVFPSSKILDEEAVPNEKLQGEKLQSTLLFLTVDYCQERSHETINELQQA